MKADDITKTSEGVTRVTSKLENLTPKQRSFIVEYIKNGGDAQNAYLEAFDTDKKTTASVNGSRLVRQGNIQEAIKAIIETEGLTDVFLIGRLKKIMDVDTTKRTTAADQIKTSEMLLNMKGVKTRQETKVTEESIELHADNIEDMQAMLDTLKSKREQLEKGIVIDGVMSQTSTESEVGVPVDSSNPGPSNVSDPIDPGSTDITDNDNDPKTVKSYIKATQRTSEMS